MYSKQGSPAAALADSPAAPEIEPGFRPTLTVAIAGSDPLGNATLRAMLESTGLVKHTEEWTWLNTVKLRNAQDVPDVVFLDLSAGMGSEFLFAQELNKLRPA